MKNPLHNELDLSSYWMPFTGNRAFKNEPRLMKSAQGLYYTTVDDRQIMDGMSGLWCCNAGHCHPHIVEAIRQAAVRSIILQLSKWAIPKFFASPNV